MISLDRAWLEKVGLADLSDADAMDLLSTVRTELEMRVGMAIAHEVTDAQLAEFEAVVDADDESASLAWLAENVSGYPKVVDAETEKIEAETREKAPTILAALTQPATG